MAKPTGPGGLVLLTDSRAVPFHHPRRTYANCHLVPWDERVAVRAAYDKFLALRRRQALKWRPFVFARDGFRCVDCDCATFARLTVDHVVPICLGGLSILPNLATRCRPCNSRKGDR